MDLDDLTDDSELGIAAAAVAALILLSPGARGLIRRGALFGLAGLQSIGASVAGLARRVTGTATHLPPRDATFMAELAREAQDTLARRRE